MTGTLVLAAALATAAAPALAGEWVYHGGPKSPDSLTWYDSSAPYDQYGYRYGGYGGYGYGPPASVEYGGGPYGAGPVWYR
jgi:hypothetical protein